MKVYYKIGDRIKDENRDLTITGQKFRSKMRKSGYRRFTVMDECYCHNCKQLNWIDDYSIHTGDYKCSICCNQKIVVGYNDVAATRPDLLKYFVNEEDSHTHTKSSSRDKIDCRCPICGFFKKCRVVDLSRYGFCCPICSSGISYPERFISSLLKQLNILFEYQVTHLVLTWADKYRYDFYIKNKHCIIETHGEQHYIKAFPGTKLEEVQYNDKLKFDLATENGIKNYFIIDCRKSNKKWIKQSVIKSKLLEFLGFTENDIDWEQCHINATDDKTLKEICDYWNQYKKEKGYVSTVIVGNYFGRSKSYIRQILVLGTSLGLCNYNAKKAKMECHRKYRNEKRFDEIIQKWNENNSITISQLVKEYNLSKTTIQHYLREGHNKALCYYPPKNEIPIKPKHIPKYHREFKRAVNIYDRETCKLILTAESEKMAAKELEKMYNIKINENNIGRVCRRECSRYGNFICRFATDDEFSTSPTNLN